MVFNELDSDKNGKVGGLVMGLYGVPAGECVERERERAYQQQVR